MGAICSNQQSQSQIHKKPDSNEVDMTVLRLKDMRDKLMDRKKQLNLSIDKEDEKIRKLIASKKTDQAKFALKCKKIYENYLTTAEEKDLVIKQMINAVDQTLLNQSLNQIMKDTNTLLRDMQKASNDLEANIEDYKENVQRQKEFQELFSQLKSKENEEIEREYYEIEEKLKLEKLEPGVLNHTVDKKKEKDQHNLRYREKDQMEERLADLA